MSEIPITTSQNVNINFSTASVGERILAFVVDMLIKVAYLVVLFLILSKFLQVENLFSNLDQWTVGAIILIITLPIHFYTLVLESLMEGQTFGKKLLKIKVVKIDGYQASFSDYLMRWIFRIVDILSNMGVVSIISTIISKNNQRLGDMAAGTAVISLKNNVNISHTILENLKEDYVPRFPQVVILTDNDMRIIKENYQKAISINDKQVIQKLSEKIQEIIKLKFNSQEFTERQFIDKIIKDYNFYTGQEN